MIYRVGLIGLWDHTSYTFGAISKLPNVKLTACACNEKNLVERHQKQYSFFDQSVKLYSDFHEMLKQEELDIVGVYTTHGQRAEALIASAQAGAHIFTEKPLTTNLKDLRHVRQTVYESHVHLSMMLNLRFDGVFHKVHQLVRSGAIGEVTQGAAQKSYKLGTRPEWLKNRGTYAGTIPYIACHALDLLRWCSGLEFVKGAAFHNNVGRPDLGLMENTASMICLASNGATFSTRLDYCRPETAASHGDDRIRLAGVDGVVEVQHETITLITGQQTMREVQPLPHRNHFENFIAAIEGRESMILPAEDCFRVTEIVLKLREAADTFTLVDL